MSEKKNTKKQTKTKTQKSSSQKKDPQTMEELLTQTDYQIKGLKRGEIIKGKIVNITPKAVYLDIGAKMEGIVTNREYEVAKDYIKRLEVGQELDADKIASLKSEVFKT